MFTINIFSQTLDSVLLTHTDSIGTYKFHHKRISGGMEQNSITNITQDSIGQMWFATKNGIVRYDGKKYYSYKHNIKNPNSIGGNFVERVFVAKSGDIWVGTEPAVLSKYNRITDDFTTIKGISGKRIKDITQDKTGLLWVTTDTELLSYNEKTKKLDKYTYKNIGLDRLLISKSNKFYITTNETYLLEFNPKSKEFKEIPLIKKEEKKQYRSTASYSAYLITQDHKGYIWISTPNGFILRYNETTKALKRYIFETNWKIENKLTVMFIFEDDMHNIWIGTWFEGLYKILPNREKVIKITPNKTIPTSLSNSIVHSGFQDKAGFLWFGHEFSGLDILKKKNKFSVVSSHNGGLPNTEYLAITKDINNTIWIGTAEQGLYYSKNENPTKFFKSNSIIDDVRFNWINTLLNDSNNILWIGTNHGLYKHNPKTKETKSYHYNKDDYNSIISDNIISLFEDSNKMIWIGTSSGLVKLNPEKEKFYRFIHEKDNPKSLSNNSVRVIYEDSFNTLWVGTFNGLNKFNKQTGDFTVFKQDYNNKNTISANRINTIYEKNKSLWIGSYEGGLTKYTYDTNKFTTFLKEDGLPDNNVKSILADQSNNLWIATTNKISKFNLTTQQFIVYDQSDGLKNKIYVENMGWQNLEFYANTKHKDKDNTMFFGGVAGVTIFNPENLPMNNYKAPTIIDKFLVNGKEVSNTKNVLYFKPSQNHFELDLAVLNFVQPEKNKIAYYLKGIDSIWNYKNVNHHIEYFNLPSGDYTFYYKGANNDGVWNEKSNMISINIAPYFYKSTLFFILILGIILALVLFFILYRVYLKKQFIKQKESLRYSQSQLKKEVADEINKKLIQFLKEKQPFLEADLSLQKLARMIEVKSHNLSQVINQYHNCSFHEFINKYRVEESKLLLKETSLKIEAVAYDSGFNSISTFNASFKKETKTTPSKYRKEHL